MFNCLLFGVCFLLLFRARWLVYVVCGVLFVACCVCVVVCLFLLVGLCVLCVMCCLLFGYLVVGVPLFVAGC